MKESEFRHYYHLDDPNWHKQYGCKVIYHAHKILISDVLKPCFVNDYTSKLAEWADTNQGDKSITPNSLQDYMVIPIKLYHPVILSFHSYSLKLCGESLPLAKSIGISFNQFIPFTTNNSNSSIYFSLSKCAEYCENQNYHTLATLTALDYINKLEENVFVANLAIKLVYV